MRKIKKFKVNLKERGIIHDLKIIADIKEITPQLEDAIRKEIKRSGEYISPASVFDTFTMDDSLDKYGIEVAQDSKATAISIIVSTIGGEIEKEIEAANANDEKLISQIKKAIGMEALNATQNFIYRILNEEAQKEESELLEIEKFPVDKEKEIIQKCDMDRISISLSEDSRIKPSYTSAVMVKWVPRGKKKQ
jgi:hypothetical protein